MAQTRRAQAHWSGDLASGGGAVSATTSGIITEQPIDWHARTESSDGMTSPEELLAAAHAACYSMAVSNELSKAGFVPERVDVSVDVGADKGPSGWTVMSSHITLRARVPGVDQATFDEQARKAMTGCPISRALSESVTVTLDATLEA